MAEAIAFYPNSEIPQSEAVPSIAVLNRLEPKPSKVDFSRALRAEVRDALWMLTRQWQFGEFKGEDTGSAIFSKVEIQHKKITKYSLKGSNAKDYSGLEPLETVVEKSKVPLDISLRIQMGQYWHKLLKAKAIESDIPAYISQYPFNQVSETSTNELDVQIVTNISSWQMLTAAIGRVTDGGALYEHLTANSTNKASDGIGSSNGTLLDEAGVEFVNWYNALFEQPTENNESAWIPERLEHQAAVYVPNETGNGNVLVADEYYHGQLDWYSFDFDTTSQIFNTAGTAPATTEKFTVIPTGVAYSGMPHSRWWQFEDGRINLGNINARTTDTAKILLSEFALIYGNDWSIVPCSVPAGSLSEIKSIVVKDVFGQRTIVDASGRGDDDDWQRWSMYNLTVKGTSDGQLSDNRLFIPPTVFNILEGEPIEKIHFMRDEMANMVWGIEALVPNFIGASINGYEAGRNVLNHITALSPLVESNSESTAKITYDLMNTVPENWIPFVAVGWDSFQNRKTRLQRGVMPRFVSQQNPMAVLPRTQLLREVDSPYYINNEEVPRSGVVVSTNFQRVRWEDGKTFVWLGKRKRVGRGEGSSGLEFDKLSEKE